MQAQRQSRVVSSQLELTKQDRCIAATCSQTSMKLDRFKPFTRCKYICLLGAHRCSVKMANHCARCHRTFGSRDALNQHLRSSTRHHPNGRNRNQNRNATAEPLPAPQRDTQLQRHFRCRSCNRSFRSQYALDSHLQNSARHIQNNTMTEEGAALASDIAPHPAYPDGNQSANQNIYDEAEMLGLYEKLSKACHSEDDLSRHRYVLRPYSSSDIAGRQKCVNCKKLAKKVQNTPCCFHPGKPTRKNRLVFNCCQKQGRGCTTNPLHDYRQAHYADKLRAFKGSPAVSPQNRKRRAIVLNCEMVTIGKQPALIQLCATDFLSGETIIKKLARPNGKVSKWRSNIHGITSAHVKEAISQGKALSGWKEARQELWNFIDTDTILVGHALHNDLDVLRIAHNRVVDSAILASAAVGQQSRQWALTVLSKELAGLEIRKNKKEIHDCLEDVRATREVVLWCLQHKQELEAWGKVKKAELVERQEATAREKAEAEKSRN